VNPGKQYGERLAKSPAYGGDGPLPDFSLIDDNGNPIAQAHDEFVRGGIDGPMAGGTGGGITFCYQRSVGVAGTYISEAPTLYPALSKISRSWIRASRAAFSASSTRSRGRMIQGTALVNGGILDPDAAVAMATKMRDAILAKFSNEIANPDDPNLVVVNPAVTVSGANVTLSVSVNDRLFNYVNGISSPSSTSGAEPWPLAPNFTYEGSLARIRLGVSAIPCTKLTPPKQNIKLEKLARIGEP
jgi:hypothetical protein